MYFLTLQILLSERKFTYFTYFTYLLQPTYKEEIDNIISSLNSSKASCPIGIPICISFLLKNKISNQLADLFNFSFMAGVFPCVLNSSSWNEMLKQLPDLIHLYFMTGVFPSILKTAKVQYYPFLKKIQN